MNKTEFKKEWKETSDKKELSLNDMIVFNILKALSARAENKLELALYFLNKSFTPISNKVKLANGYTAYQSLWTGIVSLKYKISKITLKECTLYDYSYFLKYLETDEELNDFRTLLDNVFHSINIKDDIWEVIFRPKMKKAA